MGKDLNRGSLALGQVAARLDRPRRGVDQAIEMRLRELRRQENNCEREQDEADTVARRPGARASAPADNTGLGLWCMHVGHAV